MKDDQLYLALKDLAQQLSIDVSEQNFKTAGVPVKSGLCKVKGQTRIIIDKKESLAHRLAFLAQTLAGFSLGHLYILPAVRDCLDRHNPKTILETKSEPEPNPDQVSKIAIDHDDQNQSSQKDFQNPT